MGGWSMEGKWERDGVKAEGGRRRGLVGGKIAGEEVGIKEFWLGK